MDKLRTVQQPLHVENESCDRTVEKDTIDVLPI